MERPVNFKNIEMEWKEIMTPRGFPIRDLWW